MSIRDSIPMPCGSCGKGVQEGRQWRIFDSPLILCRKCSERKILDQQKVVLHTSPLHVCGACSRKSAMVLTTCTPIIEGALQGHSLCADCFLSMLSVRPGSTKISCLVCKNQIMKVTETRPDAVFSRIQNQLNPFTDCDPTLLLGVSILARSTSLYFGEDTEARTKIPRECLITYGVLRSRCPWIYETWEPKPGLSFTQLKTEIFQDETDALAIHFKSDQNISTVDHVQDDFEFEAVKRNLNTLVQRLLVERSHPRIHVTLERAKIQNRHVWIF
ncbi:unnamed protein product [Clonostachys rosea f. rosea IK726]|uniref:Uncharacterized protein n=1 Tax=Clonostachys rosea f. rosea IK726 TaxID=1349383 RepID=A0ACA9UC01_BIOOC|nr:unnamed protein product [Clonostachys rosea f. rosea IK726]